MYQAVRSHFAQNKRVGGFALKESLDSELTLVSWTDEGFFMGGYLITPTLPRL